MDIGKILGVAGKVALTVGASVINPAAGVAVGGGLLGGSLGSKAGDKAADRTGKDVGKFTGPLGALTLPLLILGVAKAAGVDVASLCDVVQDTCNLISSMDATVLLGLAGGSTAVTYHNLTRSMARRS